MVLDQIYTRATTVEKICRSRLWTVLDGFAEQLLKRGRTVEWMRHALWHVRLFLGYLDERGVYEPTEITWTHVDAFLNTYPARRRDRHDGYERHQPRGLVCWVRRFTQYLVSVSILPPPEEPPLPYYQPLLEEVLTWMQQYCHRSHYTVRERRRYLPPFFEWMGPERLKKDGLKDLTPEILQRFILEYSSGNKPRRVARVAMAMRGFCRFCLQRGYVDRDLTAAIPSYCQRAHSRLPSGISEEDAQRALAGIDRSSPIGKRDYAILQVLHAYGVRSSHISLLRLEDIDWPAGLIHFRALKRGKSIVVPITDAVGNSLLDYLRGARPQSGLREVFLTLRPPGRVFGETAVTVIVGRRLENAGVDMFPHGAGVFRHGFATRMLAQGNTLKSIADILGHRNLGTTSIYAKVDFRALESVALEWPEDRS